VISDRVLDLASDLIAQHPLRAYDALQLAGCLALKTTAPEAPVFVCADQRLLHQAETEGLVSLDPTAP
jgi:predicted nucleic acid-binding protein